MQQFALAYYGGSRPATKEEGQSHMKNWMGWLAGLGGAVVDSGMYFGPSKHVTTEGVKDGPSGAPLNGITILQAESMEAALEMTRACPHLGLGGTIDVAPVMQM